MTNRLCASGLLGAFLFTVVAVPNSAAQPQSTNRILIEHVVTKPKLPEGGLGTVSYAPSPEEAPFYEELAEVELITGSENDDYDITKRDEKYVSWFGIVREIVEDKAKGETILTVEHKYFDGLTDTHILTVSFNGSGDFQVIVPGTGRNIEPLSLVRVYGVVAESNEKIPRIVAAFIRDWHWETFTFIDAYGRQRGSEKWRKLNQIELDDIYDPLPDVSYYRLRLGDRPEDVAWQKKIKERLLKVALAMQPDAQPRWQAFVTALCSRDQANLIETFDDAYQARAFEVLSTVLVAALQEDDVEIRNRAVAFLGDLEEFGGSAVPALIEALGDENEDVRANAVVALGNIGPVAVAASPALKGLLRSSNAEIRYAAVEALHAISIPDEELVPILIEGTKDPVELVRFMVVGVLGEIGHPASKAVEPLIELLQNDEDESIQWEAARAIGRVDADGRLGVPALTAALKSSEISLRASAVRGLAALGTKSAPALRELEPLLNDGDSAVRVAAAAEACWRAGGDLKQSLQVLNNILSSGGGLSPMLAADVVAEIGPDAREAVAALQKALQSNNSYIRESAARALGKIGPAARGAVPDLEQRLDDPNGAMRVLVAEALWQINQHPKAIPQLLKELKDEPDSPSSEAAAAVGRIGAPAADAIPLLKGLQFSRDRWTRQEANAALKKLEPPTER